ncbi:MAG TPA: SH3 domain-containing protein [Actinocatenispora sp.]
MKLKKPVIAVAMTAAVVAGVGTWATAASAHTATPNSCPDNSWINFNSGTGNLFDANGVNIRTGPSTACTSRGLGYTSHNITVHCYNNSLWSHIRDNTTGVSGWVDTHYLKISGVPCSD